MTRSLMCVVLLLTLSRPGFAHTDTLNITVASDAVYKTRTEAEAAAKTLSPSKQKGGAGLRRVATSLTPAS